ncbi:hypothetical protein [Micromonospora arida]
MLTFPELPWRVGCAAGSGEVPRGRVVRVALRAGAARRAGPGR